jgi:phenylpyruvate tautomerase PptA (4-oxalocrotonate tautomerase family)
VTCHLKGKAMPITVHATEGVLSEKAEREVFAELTNCFLRHHQLSGNPFMTPNVIGEISIIPKGRSFAGGTPADIVVVELKVPSFALADPAQKAAFVADATDIVHGATGGQQSKDRIFVNMVYAVDGLWGIAGKVYSNSDLLDAVSRAA